MEMSHCMNKNMHNKCMQINIETKRGHIDIEVFYISIIKLSVQIVCKYVISACASDFESD